MKRCSSLFSIRPIQNKYFAALDDFIQLQNSQMVQAGKDSETAATQTSGFYSDLGLGGGGISIVVAFFSHQEYYSPLIDAVRVAKRVAKGDLSSDIEVTTSDETGQMMQVRVREMNDSLMKTQQVKYVLVLTTLLGVDGNCQRQS